MDLKTKLSEQEVQRREYLEKIISKGINPYPSEEFKTTHYSQEIKAVSNIPSLKEISKDKTLVKMTGRITNRRIMGKASFVELKDSKGKFQVYFNRDSICSGDDKSFYNDVFKKWIDIGDIIGVEGYLFKTKVGEITVYVNSFKLLCKSLKPLPIVKEKEGKVYDLLNDPEIKYRQRYLDLIVNDKVKETFVKRTKITNTIRNYLNSFNYLEVETPILQPIYGGASAKPFKTYHNTLDETLYLRIANELYLKRLIVGGFDGVYEFSKDFRNEGMGKFHNPEFTQIELYVAYKDYNWMMNFTEKLIEKIAIEINGSTKVVYGNNSIDFKTPWKRITMHDAIYEETGFSINNKTKEEISDFAKSININVDNSFGKGKIIDEIFGEKCEPKYINPVFITDYPIEMSPLAKKHRNKEGLVERFEAVCNGKEICNSFSELNDPIEQRKRFVEQVELGKRGDDEAMTIDEDFLTALEYGMPPTAGLGIGIDRLCMIMTNSKSIQDVILFPQMKSKK